MDFFTEIFNLRLGSFDRSFEKIIPSSLGSDRLGGRSVEKWSTGSRSADQKGSESKK